MEMVPNLISLPEDEKVFKIKNNDVLKFYKDYFIYKDIIYNKTLLLKRGSILTDTNIHILQNYQDKIDMIYLGKQKPNLDTFKLNDIEESKNIQDFFIKRIDVLFDDKMSFIKKRSEFDKHVKTIIADVTTQILKNHEILKNLELFFLLGKHNASHLTNCAILAGKVGMQAGFDFTQLRTLITCGLLHDIGKLVIFRGRPEMDDPNYKYTRDDMLLMQNHCKLGFKLLDEYTSLPMSIKKTALMHHVWDNPKASLDKEYNLLKSYPLDYEETEISAEDKGIYVGIIQAVDVFESMTCHEYKPLKTIKETCKYIKDNIGTQFSRFAIKFLESISLYGKGDIVELNNDELAEIIEITSNLERPVIRLLTGYRRNSIIDLSKHNERLTIIQTL